MRFPSVPRTGLETLERYVRTVRYAPLIALAIFCFTGLMLFVAMGATMKRDELLLLTVILSGTGVFVTLLLRFVFGKLQVGVKRAINLLRAETPRRMLVRFTGVMTMSGSVVKLWDPGSDELSAGLLLASVRTVSKKQGSSKEAVPVDVYFSPASDRELVFEVPQDYNAGKRISFKGLSAGNVYWGRLCDRRQLEDTWKQMKLLLLGILVFSIAFVGFMGWMSQRELENARQELALGQESLSWPGAPGVILDAKLAEVSIKRGKSRVPGYEARIRYEYSLGQHTYSGSRIFFGYDAGTRRRTAEKLVNRYPPGTTAEIHYNPRDPAVAVLEPGHVEWNRHEVKAAERAMWIALTTASLLFALPLVLYVLMKRRRDKLQEELRQSMGLGSGSLKR